MINAQYDRAKQLLTEHKEGHNQLAELLISREVIFAEDVERIFGKRPWTSRSQEIMAENEKLQEQQRRLLAEKMAEERRPKNEDEQPEPSESESNV